MRSLGLLVALGLACPAQAADWLSLQGAEPGDPDEVKLRVGGFVQVSAEGIAAKPVEGLTGPLAEYNGEIARFNHVVGAEGPFRISLRRVRVGLRGAVPKTDGRVSTNLAVELGQNPLTTAADGWRPRVMDASISLHGPSGVHLRLGQFKLPLADETLEAFHITTDLVRFTPATAQLLLERDREGGRINGFRDVGVQAFGSHRARDIEISWAGMVSNGTVELSRSEPGLDLSGRLQVARLFDDPRRSPVRDEVAGYVWATSGLRDLGEADPVRRTRAGGGLHVARRGLRIRTEGMLADGALDVGLAPPFADGSRVTRAEGFAWGATALVSGRFDETWEVGAVASHLDRVPKGGPDRRTFQELTGFGQFHLSRTAWFDLNLGWRHARAPEGAENVTRILATKGPYAAVMATVIL